MTFDVVKRGDEILWTIAPPRRIVGRVTLKSEIRTAYDALLATIEEQEDWTDDSIGDGVSGRPHTEESR